MRALKKEKAIEEKIKQELDEATARITLDHGPNSEVGSDADFQGMSFDFSQDLPKIEIELER